MRTWRLVRPTALLLVVTMLFRSSQNMAQTTLSILGHDRLDMSPSLIGLVMAAASLCGVAATAWFAPRVPAAARRIVVTASMALVAASLGAFAAAPNVIVVACAAAVLGVGGGVAMPTMMTMAGSGDEARRDRDLALYTLALSASLAVGPLLEALVLGESGQSLPVAYLAFMAMPLVAIVLLVWRGVGGGRRLIGRSPKGTASAGYRALLANRQWRLAVTGTLLYQVPFVAIVAFGGAMARSVDHASPAGTELAFAAFFATSFAARAWVVRYAPIERKVGAFFVAAALTVVGLVLLATGTGVVLFAVSLAVLGIPHGLIFPVALALVAEGAGTSEGLARGNAGLLAMVNLSSVGIPALLGGLVQLFGYRYMVLAVLLPVAAFSGLLAAGSSRSGPLRSQGV
ncbi:MAG: MFS transporter [Acidimicrobiales bacterium]|nr:hypothetical protein [Actinomycetota bacterium]